MADGINIHGLGLSAAMPSALKPAAAPAEGVPSFKDTLFNAIERVNGLQQEAEKAMADFSAGRTHNVNEVMVAVQKADLAFQTLVQIRNKLLDAYQEISQMRV
jgi:flagellar hook-basal body complex protein FliE